MVFRTWLSYSEGKILVKPVQLLVDATTMNYAVYFYCIYLMATIVIILVFVIINNLT